MNWTIRMGERWVLIGPAGSGKTSIAEALAGTRRVARGSIQYSCTEDDTPSEREVILLSSESQMNTRASISPYFQARWNSYDEEDSCTVRYFMSAQGIYGLSEYHILSAGEVPSHFSGCRRQALEATGAAPLLNRKLMDLSNGELRKVLHEDVVRLGAKHIAIPDHRGPQDHIHLVYLTSAGSYEYARSFPNTCELCDHRGMFGFDSDSFNP
jgi:ABC-type cobalamin/Fe3+-siderophores transport system ATPase subunit